MICATFLISLLGREKPSTYEQNTWVGTSRLQTYYHQRGQEGGIAHYRPNDVTASAKYKTYPQTKTAHSGDTRRGRTGSCRQE